MNSSFLLPPSFDNFRIEFDNYIFESDTANVFSSVIKSRDMHLRNIKELVLSTIQSTELPTPVNTNIQQTLSLRNDSKTNIQKYNATFVDQRSVRDTIESSQLNITFVHTDAFITHLFWLVTGIKVRTNKNNENASIGNIYIHFFDSNDVYVFTTILERCFINGVSPLAPSYTIIDQTSTTFDVSFDFTQIRMKLFDNKKIHK